MNEHTLKGDWKQLKGSVKQKWADLTDDDLLHIEGSRDKLVGKVQERYGHSRDDAEREVDAWRTENNYQQQLIKVTIMNETTYIKPC